MGGFGDGGRGVRFEGFGDSAEGSGEAWDAHWGGGVQ